MSESLNLLYGNINDKISRALVLYLPCSHRPGGEFRFRFCFQIIRSEAHSLSECFPLFKMGQQALAVGNYKAYVVILFGAINWPWQAWLEATLFNYWCYYTFYDERESMMKEIAL